MIETIKKQIEIIWETLHISWYDLLYYSSYAGAGFFLGLFLRKYLKIFFSVLLVSIFLLLFLEFFNIIIINYSHIKMLFGISEVESLHEVLLGYVKTYAYELSSIALGCLLGFKIG